MKGCVFCAMLISVLQTGLFDVHPITGKITVQGLVDLDQGSESVSFVITATDQAGLSGNVRLQCGRISFLATSLIPPLPSSLSLSLSPRFCSFLHFVDNG